MYAYVRMLPFSGSISVVQRCVTFPFHSIIFFVRAFSVPWGFFFIFYFCFFILYQQSCSSLFTTLPFSFPLPLSIFSLWQRTKIQKNLKLLRKGINFFFLVVVGILPYLFCLVLPSSSSHKKRVPNYTITRCRYQRDNNKKKAAKIKSHFSCKIIKNHKKNPENHRWRIKHRSAKHIQVEMNKYKLNWLYLQS